MTTAVTIVKASARYDTRGVPVVLLLLAFVCLRPGLLGQQVTPIGVGLALTAAFVALINDRGRLNVSLRAGLVMTFVALSYVWLLIRASVNGEGPANVVQGGLISAAALLAAAVVFSDSGRAKQFARGFVFLTVGISLSYLATFVLWQVAGAASFPLFTFPVSTWTATAYFPFTPTIGLQTALGFDFPRFVGFAREPGWMAMFAALAWFTWPIVGRPNWWGKLALLAGILGPFSTAGFGIFVVVLAYDLMIKPRPFKDATLAYVRQLTGFVVLAAAAGFAVYAPIYGLAAKSQQNVLSLNERNAVTAAGIEALRNFSLGEPVDYANSSLNLIAAVAVSGWPYLVLIVLALVFPRLRHPAASQTSPLIATIFLTLLLAQPSGDSITVFMLTLLAYAVTLPSPPHNLITSLSTEASLGSPCKTGRIPSPSRLRPGIDRRTRHATA